MDLSFNLPKNNVVALPSKNPENGELLTYTLENGTRLVPMKLQYQNYINEPPVHPKQLWQNACSNDEITINSWLPTWEKNLVDNAAKHNFTDKSCWSEYAKEAYKPVIVAGSGPSIKKNYMHLKPSWNLRTDPKTGKLAEMLSHGRGDIRIVSCLHNFGFFEDMDIMTENDYYLNLDAGDITIREVYEGGTKDQSFYWERSKNRTLIATVFSNPELLSKWQGKILFFQTPSSNVPSLNKLCDINKVPTLSVGGNALGAAMYFAKAILGCGDTIFVGADFSFDYAQSFHGWNSPYDKQFSGVLPTIDIFGNRVYTWPSYYNFKCYMDFIACGGIGNNPQAFINCTEGGILGAYQEGNIRQIKQATLKDVLDTYVMHKNMSEYLENSDKIPMVLF
jgi:hypothetical protein